MPRKSVSITRKLLFLHLPFAHLSGLWQVVVEVVSTSADQCFHTAPVALASLITTWGRWRLRERWGGGGGGGGRELERGGWRGWMRTGEAHLFIAGFLSDCLDRLVEFKMQQGPCDVAIKHLPLILPDYFFFFSPPCTCACQNQLDQLWGGEAAAHPHNKPLHHLSLPTVWLLFSLSRRWCKPPALPSPAETTNFKVDERWIGTQIEYPSQQTETHAYILTAAVNYLPKKKKKPHLW